MPKVAEPHNLLFAAWKAAKGKRHAHEVMEYFENLNVEQSDLRQQLLSGNVLVGNYRYFKVFEPKERQICASAFREQVLHHALMNVCHDTFEKTQIYDSYASRKGKGNYAAVLRAKHFTYHYKWFLKLDVRKFFESIHHEVLKKQLYRMFKDETLLSVFGQIIDSYEAHPSRGLPIGNLTSQYFANHYLSSLDHYIKEDLQCKAYTRYMDDMVLWSDDKSALKKMHHAIKDFVQTNLLCELKPEALNQTKHGLPFLGYHIFPHDIRLLQKSKQRFLRKTKYIDEQYHSGNWDESHCQRHILPLLAFVNHANTNILKKNLLLRL